MPEAAAGHESFLSECEAVTRYSRLDCRDKLLTPYGIDRRTNSTLIRKFCILVGRLGVDIFPADNTEELACRMQRTQRERMMLNTMSFVRGGLIGVLPCVLACAQELPKASNAPFNPPLASIVEQMQAAQSDSKPSVSYQVVRDYQLFGEKGSEPSSEVWAQIDYLPPDHKTYAIQKRAGSGRGEDVVRRILQRESQMVAGSRSSSAINNDNYSFGYLGEATVDGNSCYLLSLEPKRKEIELIRGKAWVDQRSFLVRRIEGQMARSPSWLLKRVNLRLDFADVDGAWMQTGMEAAAEVRFLGSQTLKSQTVDARVGNMVTQKRPPEVRTRGGKPSPGRVPATVMVPHPL
jgi:hypothetical protein